VAELPLLRRFPALASIPRAALGAFPTPVERVALSNGRDLWIKRDDRTGVVLGGNKVRALEWLMGSVRPGDAVWTFGPTGSTHALATAFYARQLGATATVLRWDQEMNAAARIVAERLRREAHVLDMGNVVAAYARGLLEVFKRRPSHWIPAGGTTPLGVLGHVNAALELAEQIRAGACPQPGEIVVPLGTGGTAAGLILGLRIAGLRAAVRAVRVAPRVIASGARVLRLANRTRSLIQRATGEALPRAHRRDILVDGEFYGGGYGHPIGTIREEAALDALRLDDTYSRKTFAAAVGRPSDAALFWLTFDGRLLGAS
jgi:D-cysteine desulfhydrase